jgi:2-oxoglutarate dehydrogenase E1 component
LGESLQSKYASSHIGAPNAAYVESLFEAWLENPDAVTPQWQALFRDQASDQDTSQTRIIEQFRALSTSGHYRLGGTASGLSDGDVAMGNHKQAGVLKMINAYRVRGHQRASLDPLGLRERPTVPDLNLAAHDLQQSDLQTRFDTGSLVASERLPLAEIVELVENVYCGTIGSEVMHITDTEQRRWLQQRLEGSRGDFRQDAQTRLRILEKLTAAEGWEQHLHRKYTGQKRFSLEGGDSLIPLLNELIIHSGQNGSREVVIGMAHRGRLNVLVNIIGKRSARLFEEFEGKLDNGNNSNHAGDVKYHLGYSSDIQLSGGKIHLALAFNPSHLEIVGPVVVGSARARQILRHNDEQQKVLPVLIHGDAAIAGQGVVMELFNMSQARGFAVGGTLHVVVNNQVGFTTSNPIDARSTLYCTEVAKMVQAPIFHVNADDPEAVVFVTKLADDFRKTFKKDVVIDLVCYRRHGHNEADEPSATQPMMYHKIREHASARALLAQRLIADGLIDQKAAEKMQDGYRERLDAGERLVDAVESKPGDSAEVDWSMFLDQSWRAEADTSISPEQISALSTQLHELPAGFELHARVDKVIKDRRKMAAGELPMDWGFAETMAYAGLVSHGHGLRLVGQDSGRGTFFHRHAILHDQNTGKTILPLDQVASKPELVTVIDSLLSEEAVLGFEYGFATTDPNTLVIWEAQFGDFANGAQVLIDQFITSGETKWGRLCGLTMFLPHGYEGQGPEHSSARLERFLQMCAQENIQVCVPSLPSQFFHLIRRQVLRPYRKPLVVMTPKSLLRHRASVSALDELTSGGYQLVIDDTSKLSDSNAIKRVVLCAGKVYFDLAAKRDEEEINDIAICRIEQFYPFPDTELAELLQGYKNCKDVIWCQEEPANQGAWRMIRHRLISCLSDGQTLDYVGRDELASPAVGYASVHVREQQQLVNDALLLV